MAGFLTNTITNYTRREIDGYAISDYKTIDLTVVYDYMQKLPADTFDWYQVQDDDKWERISLELYQNANYWDILLVLNQRDTLTGLPFRYDIVAQLAEDSIVEYQSLVYHTPLPTAEHDAMLGYIEPIAVEKNEATRVIKIINPSSMNRFLQDGYDLGIF